MKKLILILTTLLLIFTSCNDATQPATSDSGVSKATIKIPTDQNGNTIEQRNIMERLKRDNEPGSIKHLYVISAYTGDVLQYSTVRGKVTSGGKRLSPKTVEGDATHNAQRYSNWVTLNNNDFITDEVLDDGGAYGESGNYVYWFDANDLYHQYFPSGGTYLYISDRPVRIKKINFSVENIIDTASHK